MAIITEDSLPMTPRERVNKLYCDGHLDNPFMSSGQFYLSSFDRSISNSRGVWLVSIITIFSFKFLYLMHNVDPDKTLRSAASDLGLNYLSMSFVGDT